MNPAASTVAPPRRAFARNDAGPILLFFIVGLIQTVIAYFAFSRADDHSYFLELATKGLEAVPDFSQDSMDFKAKAAGLLFYVVTTPGRWLGGHELTHLLWLRVLTLIGFLHAFSWFKYVIKVSGTDLPTRDVRLNVFLLLVLIYPGQLAWTASLLRDGVATSLFFVGLNCLRWSPRIAFAPFLFMASFAMRPEYALILVCLLAALLGHRLLRSVRHRVLFILAVVLAVSIAAHPIQVESAAFGQLAFGEDGTAYPIVSSTFDFAGYLQVLLQGLVDPTPLSAPLSARAFNIADCLFFLWLLWRSRHLVRQQNTLVAGMTMGLLLVLWLYAYFEIYVGGFSRHRLCIEAAMIAIVACAPLPARRTSRRRRRRQKLLAP